MLTYEWSTSMGTSRMKPVHTLGTCSLLYITLYFLILPWWSTQNLFKVQSKEPLGCFRLNPFLTKVRKHCTKCLKHEILTIKGLTNIRNFTRKNKGPCLKTDKKIHKQRSPHNHVKVEPTFPQIWLNTDPLDSHWARFSLICFHWQPVTPGEVATRLCESLPRPMKVAHSLYKNQKGST